MSTLTIRNIDDDLKIRLRIRAAEHGRSMEAEVRDILRLALQNQAPNTGLGTWMHHRFAEIGGAELDLPERSEQPRYVDFDE
jgi:plasmid stability protein